MKYEDYGSHTPNEQQLLLRILKNHRGRANAITSGEIETQWQLDGGGHDTNPKIRSSVKTLIADHGFPIGSSSEGFFMIDSQEDLAFCVEGFEKSIMALRQRETMLIEAFKKHHPDSNKNYKQGNLFP